ncbi:unnamed protein product, partial [Scytosiphon promiscuus]
SGLLAGQINGYSSCAAYFLSRGSFFIARTLIWRLGSGVGSLPSKSCVCATHRWPAAFQKLGAATLLSPPPAQAASLESPVLLWPSARASIHGSREKGRRQPRWQRRGEHRRATSAAGESCRLDSPSKIET